MSAEEQLEVIQKSIERIKKTTLADGNSRSNPPPPASIVPPTHATPGVAPTARPLPAVVTMRKDHEIRTAFNNSNFGFWCLDLEKSTQSVPITAVILIMLAVTYLEVSHEQRARFESAKSALAAQGKSTQGTLCERFLSLS